MVTVKVFDNRTTMLELLKILAETLTKLISPEAIATARRNKKLSTIGTDLFLLYSALNSVIVQGKKILAELEGGLDWMRRKTEGGEPDRVFGCNLQFQVTQQLFELRQFVYAYERLAMQLEVIEPEARALYPILQGKLNALSLLAGAIQPYKGPGRLVSIDEEKMKALMILACSSKEEDQRAIREATFGFNDLMNGLIIESGIDNLAVVKARQFPFVERYLAGKARADLDELERLARNVRVALEKNFSLQDILLAVGDRRAATEK